MILSVANAVEESLKGHHRKALRFFELLLREDRAISPHDILEAAYAYDRAGKEKNAVPLYLAALQGDLTEAQRINVYFCLASSYRTIGRINAARNLLLKAIREFPQEPILKILLSIVDYDGGNPRLAFSRLLSVCREHARSESIVPYRYFFKREERKALRRP